MLVKDLEDRKDLIFVSDSQDVQAIREYLGHKYDDDYDSYFVKVGEGEYEEVYGMYGIIPYLKEQVYKIF